MKKYIGLFVLLSVVLALSSIIVLAGGVDDQGNPNDPAVNDRANACFEGGAMEGKCTEDWQWVCGWYLIRASGPGDAGYDISSMPAYCESLVVEAPGTVCVGPVGEGAYFLFDASNISVTPMAYLDAACTNPYAIIPLAFVYAPAGQAAAEALCQQAVGSPTATFAGSDVYGCGI